MEKYEDLWEELRQREGKLLIVEEYKHLLNEIGRSSRICVLVFKIVENVVDKITSKDNKDFGSQIKEAKSALQIIIDIEGRYKIDLALEKNLISSALETNFIKLLKKNSTFSLVDNFKDYIINLYTPYNDLTFLNSFSVFQAVLRYLNKNPEKWSEVARILLDPEIKNYEFYMELKYKYYSRLLISFKRNYEKRKNFIEKLVIRCIKPGISLYKLEQQGGFRVIYGDSEDQFEMFLFDFNVFLSLNLLFTSIRLIGVFVNLKIREVSLSFDYFGINLFDFIKNMKKKKRTFENSQILFIIKLIAQATVNLLNHRIFIEFLHPYNIFLFQNKISVLPKSYFGRCMEVVGLDTAVFRCSECKGELEKGLSYSLGVIFLYFTDQNLTVSNFVSKKESILNKCDNETRKFIEGLISYNKRIDLRQALDLL